MKQTLIRLVGIDKLFGMAAAQAAFIAFLVLITPSLAHGATVTVTASGPMNEYFDPDGLMPFSKPPDASTLTVTFTYDSGLADFVGTAADPTYGLYFSTGTSISFAGPGGIFQEMPLTLIIINDDFPQDDPPVAGTLYDDAWVATGDEDLPASEFEHDITFQLSTDSLTVPIAPLTSDSLVPPPGPENWEIAWFQFTVLEPSVDPDGDPIARGFANAFIETIEVTTVPIPAAVWFFSSGLGVLGWMWRKAN